MGILYWNVCQFERGRKLKGAKCEKFGLGGRKLKGRKLKGAEIRGRRKLKGLRYVQSPQDNRDQILVFSIIFLLNPIHYGLRLHPEDGRLRLKQWICNESGLKVQKNPNQFHVNSEVGHSSISLFRCYSGVVAIYIDFTDRLWQNGHNFSPDHGNAAKFSGNMQN